MNLRDTPKFQRGEAFERALSAHLQSKGDGILPVYNYGGLDDKAPLLERQRDGNLVLPDLLCMRDGHIAWCEAKRKKRADWTRLTQRLETGIDTRLYDQYRRVKAESGLAVYLVFGHEMEDSVRYCEIDEFPPRHSPKFNNGRGGIFWGWEELHQLCTLSSLLGAAPAAS